MNKMLLLLVSGFMMITVSACSNAKTASDAPNSTEMAGEAPTADTSQTAQNDAQSEVRKNQLESDIRANEQRNNATGGDLDRADGELQTEVRSKLEANIPNGRLTVEAEDGAVTVGGTVPTQEQLAKIEPLAKEIKGVQRVVVNATVAPAQ